jgi:NTE family protein
MAGEPREPELSLTHDDPQDAALGPKPGIALCLSGGGFRAMLFHLGALWRLNEAGYLGKLDRVSSVSGGSIIAASLGLAWPRLGFDTDGVAARFEEELVGPIRALAGRTIDVPSVLRGLGLPGPASRWVERAYRKRLYGNATLQDLPDDQGGPRFVINATNLQTGVLLRFSRPYAWDYLMGKIDHPTVRVAAAVAASSAFPPVLSPFVFKCEPSWFAPGTGEEPFNSRRYRRRVGLSDGGVYDNLGLETAWKRYQTILVSDGGAPFKRPPRTARDWLRGTVRVLHVEDNQVRSLRKRQLIEAFQHHLRAGAYWGIATNIADYHLGDVLPCPPDHVKQLARVKTRLAKVGGDVQERLVNWGYAVSDAALRRWVDPAIRKGTFPYPGQGV